MSVLIRTMSILDYPSVMALWQRTPGIHLNAEDEEPAIAAFLERNRGLSAVAVEPDFMIVGAVLCGHDGRRGYLHHLAVDAEHQRQGVATRLVSFCLKGLAGVGIHKCNAFLLEDNPVGENFWIQNDWVQRPDLRVFQKRIE
jgi:putative acetyltransferase